MRGYLLSTILPRMPIWKYVTYRGTPTREPTLDTIPRVSPPVLGDYDRVVSKAEVLKGLNNSKHYGLVRELSPEYKRWLLESYFNPWAAAWLGASVYMWWAQTFTESGGGGGSLPWIRSIITADNRSAEDEVHELAHSWEVAKTAEGLWTPRGFTEIVWLSAIPYWPVKNDWQWANAFQRNVLAGPDPEAFNETFASTASRVMGEKARLPYSLQPYFAALFR